MNKNKKQLLRLQSLIENDRISTGDNFNQMVINDVAKLLRDYFDFKLSPNLSIEKNNDSYYVNIFINASRIKGFTNVQK